MLLSDSQIKTALRDGRISISPNLEDIQIQPASIDLRLGNQFTQFTRQGIAYTDSRNPQAEMNTYFNDHSFVLYPNIFTLATTLETVTLSGKEAVISWQESGAPYGVYGGRYPSVTRTRVYPTLTGRVEGRSSLARLGLGVHFTAGFIDPGFSGQITLELINLSPLPIILYVGDRICQMALFETGQVSKPYNSKYMNQNGATMSKGVL